jgi:anti-sigma regulatory factor (Ser/Thr protein kinase)
MPGIPVTGTPGPQERETPARSHWQGAARSARWRDHPDGKASVSNTQSLQRQSDLLRPLAAALPRAVAWKRRPVAPASAPGTTYAATAEAVPAARGEVARIAVEAGASKPALADIKLAVGEALANAVFHAHAGGEVRGESFTVATAAAGPLFSVWVTDEGQGCTPDVPSSGLGLGLPLMAKLCQRLEIGVLADGRSQVELRFDLGAAAGEPSPSRSQPVSVSPAARAFGIPAKTQPPLRQRCARCGLTISARSAWLTIDYCPRCLARARVAIRLGDPERAPGGDGYEGARGLGVRDRSTEGG